MRRDSPYQECFHFELLKDISAFKNRLYVVVDTGPVAVTKLVREEFSLLTDSFDFDLDRSDPTTLFSDAVRLGKVHQKLFDDVVSKLEAAKKRMRNEVRISWLSIQLSFLREYRTSIQRQVREVTPVHVALQRHMAAFVKPLSGEGWRYDMNLQNLRRARDEFFRTGAKSDFDAYLQLFESLADTPSQEKLGFYESQTEATKQELAELEVAALMTF